MILICYGTRPEFIKVKPLIDKLIDNKIEFRTLFTGQHEHIIDEYNSDHILNIPNYENRLNSIVSSGLNFTFSEDITHVLIQGDTSSALSMAMSAFNNNLKVIHLEAGLRTYDQKNPYPEESNRQLISRITDIHLCPTELNKKNLLSEKVGGEIYVVGNTGLDNLLPYKKNCEYGNKVLVTLHRRENHELIKEYFKELSIIASKYNDLEFVLPIHPNPNIKKHKNLLNNINVIEPISHKDLIEMLIKTKFIITDSGGLQEECSFFNKKAIVCRKITERPESVDIHSFMCNSPKDLDKMVVKIKNDYSVNEPCPYGDGETSMKIVNIFKKLI